MLTSSKPLKSKKLSNFQIVYNNLIHGGSIKFDNLPEITLHTDGTLVHKNTLSVDGVECGDISISIDMSINDFIIRCNSLSDSDIARIVMNTVVNQHVKI